MQIIPNHKGCNGCSYFIRNDCKAPNYPCYINRHIEITDKEWNTIAIEWIEYNRIISGHKPFSQYLYELIELRRVQ